jgi:hypothetical protein
MNTVQLIQKLQAAASDMWQLVMRHHDTLENLQQYYERAITVEDRKRIEQEIASAESNIKVTIRSYGLIMKNIEELCMR